jgi:hypothetical protein
MSNQELIEILAEVRWEADRKAAAGMVVSAAKKISPHLLYLFPRVTPPYESTDERVSAGPSHDHDAACHC